MLLARTGRNRRGRIGGSGLPRREVAITRARREFTFSVRRDDFHLNGAERAIFFGVGWIIAEGVLVADVARYLIANIVHVVDVFWKIGNAAGDRGNIFQSAHGLFAVLFILIAEQANAVNHHIGFL